MTIPSDKAKAMTPLNTLKNSHPTIIKISFNHNHPIDSAHVLSFQPVALQVKEAYYQLFKTGHLAATARHTYETWIMLENDERDMMHVLSDRAVNPNPQDVSHLFAEWRSHNLGAENGIEMFDKLDALMHEYNLRIQKMEVKLSCRNTQLMHIIKKFNQLATNQVIITNHHVKK